MLTLNEEIASPTALSINSSEILRDGCSLNTEFIRAILAALLLASAFVVQFCDHKHMFLQCDIKFGYNKNMISMTILEL